MRNTSLFLFLFNRYSYDDLNQSEIISVLSLFSHWLCYANSAVNPLIYNFMSGDYFDEFSTNYWWEILMVLFFRWIGKFRREFRNVLERGHCLKYSGRQRGRARHQSEFRSRNLHDDQEQSFIHSTTHMIHLQPSIKRTYGQVSFPKNLQFNAQWSLVG